MIFPGVPIIKFYSGNVCENYYLSWTIFWLAVASFFLAIPGLICLIVGIIPAIIWIDLAFATIYWVVSTRLKPTPAVS